MKKISLPFHGLGLGKCLAVAFIGLSSVWILFGASLAMGKSADSSYRKFQKGVRSRVCRARLETLKDFRRLFVLPEFRTLLAKGKSKHLGDALRGWSSDLLVKIVLELEQEYQILCPEHKKLRLVLDQLKRAFLEQAGVSWGSVSKKNIDLLFRGLLSLRDEMGKLRERVAVLKEKKSANQILADLFGKLAYVRSVAVLGGSAKQIGALNSMVEEICSGFSSCPFWDRNLIYKTVVTKNKGVAAYLPEVAVLILSGDLLSKPDLLHKVVVLHELSHVAERGAWVFQRRHWRNEFVKFSGWKRDKAGKWGVKTRQPAAERTDDLTKLSEDSPFSILPDPVYLGVEDKKKNPDGFVFGKSYEESLKRNDPSEDLADHIAAFFYFPERYCFEGKNLAPKKYRWIARNVFGTKPPRLPCSAADEDKASLVKAKGWKKPKVIRIPKVSKPTKEAIKKPTFVDGFK